MLAVDAAISWLDRWAQHVGDCKGGDECTCGLTAVRHELDIAFHPENWETSDPGIPVYIHPDATDQVMNDPSVEKG